MAGLNVGGGSNPISLLTQGLQQGMAGLKDLQQGLGKLLQGDIKGAMGELASALGHMQKTQQAAGQLAQMGMNPMASMMLNAVGTGLQQGLQQLGSGGGSAAQGGGNPAAMGGMDPTMMNVLQLLSGAASTQGANGPGAAPQGAGQTAGAQGAGQGGPSAMTGQDAAGALGGYMHEKGMDTMDPNGLYKLANDKSAPPDVQNAAKFMLANPDQWAKVETNDVKGKDGLSSVANLDTASQGKIGGMDGAGGQAKGPQGAGGQAFAPQGAGAQPFAPLGAGAQPPAPQGAGAQRGQPAMDTQSAAGALGGFMHEKGMDKIDANGLYKLANNKSAPPDVQNAAKFLLAHPDQFAKIETNDVKGKDGLSGVGNFDAAAQGKKLGTNAQPA
jgi:hypothetical protein